VNRLLAADSTPSGAAARPNAAAGELRRTGVTMGRLTTHVLDTALGKPAAGLTIELFRIGTSAEHVITAKTNADGRVEKPLLDGGDFKSGVYELRFHAGDYLRKTTNLPDPAFLDVVPIRFGIASESEHYHVPLLLSPYSYSTYRGS
jgi:5-hydroxyisourate hydrolase